MRRDFLSFFNILKMAVFQSTRLREARRFNTIHHKAVVKFQSTRLREARPDDINQAIAGVTFQSTRLREARQRN